MSKSAVRHFLTVLILLPFCFLFSSAAQTPSKPLRASEVMALQAGGALQANIVHDVETRGLRFHADDNFVSLMTKAGADSGVIEALKRAKVSEEGAAKPDYDLLRKLSEAAVFMKDKKYGEAGSKLSDALDASFARMETGFVMAELLRQQNGFEKAAAVYEEILQKEPDFPEVHNKASYVLYRLGDDEDALREAKAAMASNANDAEAHQNAGLALSDERKFDAAIAEFKEALRIKPDYAGAHSGLGLLYSRMHSYDDAIAEYKKAIAADPDYANAHYNLGISYVQTGNIGAAVAEYREAKRLNPYDPAIRQNLSSALMQIQPLQALAELEEMEAKFPNFEMCHVCLGNGLVWAGDFKGAEAEYRTAMKLDPSDADPHGGLGDIQEKQKNYDAALQEFRVAERLSPDSPDFYKSAGRVLMAKKNYAAAEEELSKAEKLSPSSWEIHELYAKAAMENRQSDLAISEFKEAVSLDPKQGQVMTEFGGALEKKGDWVGALEQYRRGALTDANRLSKAQPGQPMMMYDPDPQRAYTAAKARFADYLVSLRAAGKNDEAADLDKRVQMLATSGSTLEKVQAALQEGEQAFRNRQFDEAEKQYQQAVALAEQLPPGDENLIVALGRLGNAYGMRQDYTDAEAAFHRQMGIIEKTFGPRSPRMTDPLRFLGSMAIGRKDFVAAESYFSRALEITVAMAGEKSAMTSEALRSMAGLYEIKEDWPKAETYLLRAVKANESDVGQDDNMLLVPLWGLCDLYDRTGRPEKSQPCWHRATGIMEKQVGESSPDLAQSLTSEANAFRKLGKSDEAETIERRLAKIQRTSAKTN